jgi:hypothetical protein
MSNELNDKIAELRAARDAAAKAVADKRAARAVKAKATREANKSSRIIEEPQKPAPATPHLRDGETLETYKQARDLALKHYAGNLGKNSMVSLSPDHDGFYEVSDTNGVVKKIKATHQEDGSVEVEVYIKALPVINRITLPPVALEWEGLAFSATPPPDAPAEPVDVEDRRADLAAKNDIIFDLIRRACVIYFDNEESEIKRAEFKGHIHSLIDLL